MKKNKCNPVKTLTKINQITIQPLAIFNILKNKQYYPSQKAFLPQIGFQIISLVNKVSGFI